MVFLVTLSPYTFNFRHRDPAEVRALNCSEMRYSQARQYQRMLIKRMKQNSLLYIPRHSLIFAHNLSS